MQVCAEPGCPELVPGRYCNKHRKRGSPSDKVTSTYAHKKRRARLLRDTPRPICHICNQPIDDPPRLIHADHVTPLSMGGAEHVISLSHASCNLEKGDRLP